MSACEVSVDTRPTSGKHFPRFAAQNHLSFQSRDGTFAHLRLRCRIRTATLFSSLEWSTATKTRGVKMLVVCRRERLQLSTSRTCKPTTLKRTELLEASVSNPPAIWPSQTGRGTYVGWHLWSNGSERRNSKWRSATIKGFSLETKAVKIRPGPWHDRRRADARDQASLAAGALLDMVLSPNPACQVRKHDKHDARNFITLDACHCIHKSTRRW